MLKDHPHFVTADIDQILVVCLEKILSIEHHLSHGRLNQTTQATDQGRLSTARKSHNDEDLTFGNLQADISNGTDQTCTDQLRCLRSRF